MPHIMLYDGECGLCDRAVQTLLKIDDKELFAFAPLQGPTAALLLAKFPPLPKDVDSVVLIEDFHTAHPKQYIRGKAVFRALWLEGGWWTFLGWPYFLPAWMYDWAYKIVARNRYRMVAQRCVLPLPSERKRFLE